MSLANLQAKLKQDPAFRSQFLQNPVQVLKQNGVDLNPDQANNLAQQIKNLGTNPNAVSVGVTVGF